MNLQDIEEIEEINDDVLAIRAVKRYIRDGQNSFEFYSNLEVEFKKHFRFSKNSVMYEILPKIENNL